MTAQCEQSSTLSALVVGLAAGRGGVTVGAGAVGDT